MIGRVQKCGCIALPDSVQEQTGLHPGATYEIEVSQDGAAVLLRPIETAQPSEPEPGVRRGRSFFKQNA
jgi:bifunctional DNA-binding transcriptional regulator/antitoxin component of YhaV-PrlF toxin-antitoxin module